MSSIFLSRALIIGFEGAAFPVASSKRVWIFVVKPEFADLFYAYGVLDSGRFIGESSHLVGLGSNQASFYLRA